MWNSEQAKEIIEALVEFVKRVSKGECINENETKILPAIVTLSANFRFSILKIQII